MEGAHFNDRIVLIAKLTYAGKTSLEVREDTDVESI